MFKLVQFSDGRIGTVPLGGDNTTIIFKDPKDGENLCFKPTVVLLKFTSIDNQDIIQSILQELTRLVQQGYALRTIHDALDRGDSKSWTGETE